MLFSRAGAQFLCYLSGLVFGLFELSTVGACDVEHFVSSRLRVLGLHIEDDCFVLLSPAGSRLIVFSCGIDEPWS
jgi:hypothetical protein